MLKKSISIITAVIILDRVSKIIFLEKRFSIINHVENTGGAFGLFPGANLLFIFLSVLIIIFLFYYLINSRFKHDLPISFIIAGLTSNLIDRIYFGHVQDFIDLKVWPVFNIADIFIVAGVFILIIQIIKK